MPKPRTMDELLAKLPDTGITDGNQDEAEYVATHPETWEPIHTHSAHFVGVIIGLGLILGFVLCWFLMKLP